jgi:hypothetical protein
LDEGLGYKISRLCGNKRNPGRIETPEHTSINITAEEGIKHIELWKFTVFLESGQVDISQVRHQKCSFYNFYDMNYFLS